MDQSAAGGVVKLEGQSRLQQITSRLLTSLACKDLGIINAEHLSRIVAQGLCDIRICRGATAAERLAALTELAANPSLGIADQMVTLIKDRITRDEQVTTYTRSAAKSIVDKLAESAAPSHLLAATNIKQEPGIRHEAANRGTSSEANNKSSTPDRRMVDAINLEADGTINCRMCRHNLATKYCHSCVKLGIVTAGVCGTCDLVLHEKYQHPSQSICQSCYENPADFECRSCRTDMCEICRKSTGHQGNSPCPNTAWTGRLRSRCGRMQSTSADQHHDNPSNSSNSENSSDEEQAEEGDEQPDVAAATGSYNGKDRACVGRVWSLGDDSNDTGSHAEAGSGAAEHNAEAAAAQAAAKDRINKALQRALHPNTPAAERENAFRVARLQAVKHNLSDQEYNSLLADAGSGVQAIAKDKGRIVQVQLLSKKSIVLDYVYTLARAVSTAAGVSYYYAAHANAPYEFNFYGLENNARVAGDMFEAAYNIVIQHSKAKYPTRKHLKLRNAYCTGLADGLWSLVNEGSAEDAKELAIVNKVSEAMYPELKEAIGLVDGPVRKRKQLDQELLGAYNIGWADAGDVIDLKRQRLKNTAAAGKP